MPLNLHEAAGLLVTSAVIDRHCLTALVLMVVSCFVDESLCGFDRGRQFDTMKNRFIYPFKRAYPQGTGQPKLDKKPAGDRMPEGTGDSVATGH